MLKIALDERGKKVLWRGTADAGALINGSDGFPMPDFSVVRTVPAIQHYPIARGVAFNR